VAGKKGKVLKVNKMKDQFGSPIIVHTIKFYSRFSHYVHTKEGKKSIYKPYNKTQNINYSSIVVKNK